MCLIQKRKVVIHLSQIYCTVCLFGLLATLAALLTRFFIGNKEVMGRISYSAIGQGCHGASKVFFSRQTQRRTDGPFIVIEHYFSPLSGDRAF